MMQRPLSSLQVKFFVGTQLILLSVIVLAASTYLALKDMNAPLQEAAAAVSREHQWLFRTERAISEYAFLVNDYVARRDDRKHQNAALLAETIGQLFLRAATVSDETVISRALNVAEQEWQAALSSGQYILAAGSPRGDVVLLERNRLFNGHIGEALASLHEAADAVYQRPHAWLARALDLQQRGQIRIWVIFACAAAISLITTLFLFQTVLAPLRQLRRDVGHISRGHYGHRSQLLAREDDYGNLASDLNAMATQLEHYRAEIAESAARDKLTGLYNGEAFMRKLVEEVSRSRRYRRVFSLLLLEVDGFRHTLDTYGREASDVMIRSIAATVSGEIRLTDCFGRFGEGRFGLLLPETDKNGSQVVAGRIVRDLGKAEIPVMQGHSIGISLTIAYGCYPQLADKEHELYDRTYAALESAIMLGGNIIVDASSSAGG